jgi:hypothetical protein
MPTTLRTRATFELLLTTDTLILLQDCDQGASVTNDAEAVIQAVSTAVGGIGRRRVYYRDTMGRFDELVVEHERFAGFKPGTLGQQRVFAELLDDRQPAT